MKAHVTSWVPFGKAKDEEIILGLTNESEAELYQLESLLGSLERFGVAYEIKRDSIHGKIMLDITVGRK